MKLTNAITLTKLDFCHFPEGEYQETPEKPRFSIFWRRFLLHDPVQKQRDTH
jgi:hypothetical protein